MAREIQLRGRDGSVRAVALVDDDDYERVNARRWYLGSQGYVTRGRGGCRVYLHRWLLDAPDGMDVDHIDGNALNNQRANLRLCTRSENLGNQRRSKNNTSGYKGVRRLAGRWGAFVRQQFLGLYDTPEEAARAYDDAARRVWGRFARPNFPAADAA